MKTKLQLIILCLLLFFAGGGKSYAWNYPTSKPSHPFTSGDGSSSKPYEIRDAQDLANLAYMVCEGGEDYSGKYFVMTKDITLNTRLVNADCTDRNTGDFKVWTSIGKYGFWSDKSFKGDFNGNSHTIYGLFIEAKDNFNGLFGVIDGGTIRNLTIADSYMCASYPCSTSNYYGFIAGETSNATFLNCHVKNSCIRNSDNPNRHLLAIGGLVGHCKKGGIFRKCSFNGNFNLHSFDTAGWISAGGLIGYGGRISDTVGEAKLYYCSTKGKFTVTGSPCIEVYGMGIILSEAYGCVAGMDFDIQTHGEYYTGWGFHDPIEVASFASTSGRCTQCVTYGTIKVGEPDNPIKVQPLTNREYKFYNICIGTFSSSGEYRGDSDDIKNQCAAYTNVELYLHDDSKGNAYITSFGLGYIREEYEGNALVTELKNCIVAGKHIVQSTSKIGYNPVTLYDGGSVNGSDNSWERVQGAKYCTYVNSVKDEDAYFRYKDQKFESITPEELTGDKLLAELNALSEGSNQWGRITTEGDLKGYPMPVICGGSISDMKGSGTQEAPYLIGSEADLRNFQKTMETEDSEGKYYKLTADIDMSEQAMPAIGPQKNPFQGTFDGNGHSINGLVTGEGYLFHYLQGTVKNLTLLDYKGKADKTGNVTSIACFVGGSADGGVSKPGYIKNCYVSGNIEAYRSSYALDYDVRATGLCLNIYEPSTMENCYFKGNIKVSSKTVDGNIVNSGIAGLTSPAYTYLYVGGLASAFDKATESTNPIAINRCYASFNYECDETGKAFDSKTVNGTIANTAAHQNVNYSYYVCDKIDGYQSSEKLGSESELNDKLGSFSGWTKGYYRPVVEGTKYYTATLPDESRTVTCLDAIPEANPNPNFIMNVETADDPYADKHIWQLPNVAVYVPSENADFILNCTLDPSADLKYNRTEDASRTVGQLCYTLKQNASGYHMLCLPGVVERDDLPKDSKVMIYGKIRTNGTSQEINEVHVDTIPAGVPCILYVPVTAYNVGSDIPLVMRGEIRSKPLIDDNYSSMKGTFRKMNDVSDACITATKREDGNVYFEKSASAETMKPFTAWLEGAGGDVKIVDYVLLDEENEAMTVTLAGLNSTEAAPKTTNVKMRRTIKTGKWNTVCLPFDMTAEEIASTFGEGTKVEEFSGIEYTESTKTTTLKFSAAEADSEGGAVIQAGTPYLLKPGIKTDASIFDLEQKKISCVSVEYVPTGTTNNVTTSSGTVKLTMQGEYNRRMISSDNSEDSDIYVISGNKIYYVDSEVEMKGFRCYFVAKEYATGSTAEGTSMFSNARVLHSDGSSTDLRLIKADATGEGGAVYDLLGRKRDEQTKGIVIENGKKIIIK